MFKIEKINFYKLFFSIITIFLLLFTISIYMFSLVNKKSDEILYHKTSLIENISTIKYKLSSVHLWFMEYMSGEEKEKNKVMESFLEIERILNQLKKQESSNKEIYRSDKSDEKLILNNIQDILIDIQNFKLRTSLYLDKYVKEDQFSDIAYDYDYEILINKIKTFDIVIKNRFLVLSQELEIYKLRGYLLFCLLIILTLFFSFLVIRNEKPKIAQIRQKDKFIAEQYKLSAMGEMIDAIAHQWKNPLGIIRMHADFTQISIEVKGNSDEQIHKDMGKIMLQVDHLVNTIDEFRSYFRPNTKLETVPLKKLIDSTLILVKDEMINHHIMIDVKCDENIKLQLNQNEFKHVLINILQNTRDALLENKIAKGKIKFIVKKNKKQTILKIFDNAGGIQKDIIEKIFAPHFTTKAEGKGTGIGLYLTKQIVEKHHATIDAKNYKDGVCFSIIFNNQ